MPGRVDSAHFSVRKACPVCGEAETRLLYSVPLASEPARSFIASHYAAQGQVNWSLFSGTDFDVMHCGTCDLIYQRHVPNDATFHHLYNEMISPGFLAGLERGRLSVNNFLQVAGEMAVLFRLAGKAPADITFLDFGFGHGRWARVARALGAKVFATETGEEKKAMAASLGIQILADEEVDGMRFDIVHTEQVLEHVLEPGREFGRLAAVTDRLLKVSVPTRGTLEKLLPQKGLPLASPFSRDQTGTHWSAEEKAFTAIQPLEHLNAFSARTLGFLADRHHMTLESMTRRRDVAVSFDTPGGFAKSLVRLAAAMAKQVVKSPPGYYLFRPASAR
jgi:hypothetical protein